MAAEFTGDLANFLEYGHVLEIEAEPFYEAKYFHIDLCTAKLEVNPQADVGLRFSCYFDETFLRRNSRIKGEWGNAEITAGYDGSFENPLKSSERFSISIACAYFMFHITVNDRPFCTFNYRLAREMLSSLEIRGDIDTVYRVSQRTVFPLAWPIPRMCKFSAEQHVFIHDVPKQIMPGHVMVMTARCFGKKKKSFVLNFPNAFNSNQILFHMSVRYDEKSVVRNSQDKDGNWIEEERDGGFPFVFDSMFKLAIAFTRSAVLIAVDGNSFFNYAFRVTSDNILEHISGFSCARLHYLLMEITGIDHIQMADVECEGFEKYSRHDYLGREDLFEHDGSTSVEE